MHLSVLTLETPSTSLRLMTNTIPWTRFPIEATGNNVMKGVRFVKRLKANGGTVAQPALHHALLMNSQQNRVKMIVFLTDGDVGNEDELITLVKDNIDSSRLFTVGIGSAPNGYLLEKVSRSGRGTFTYISKISEVEQKMNALLTRIEQPRAYRYKS